ncbi:MAG: HAMP domain-containing histidine kinase [Deltaproteobacteria bacterium]|nr:HAMP domain-containing histidine kinase [Deltaproteobacteria bacterium]
MSAAVTDSALEKLFHREAWASERVLNYLRAGLFSIAGVAELYDRSQMTVEHITWMPALLIAWGTCAFLLNRLVLRTVFFRWFAVLFTACDVAVIVGALTIARHHLATSAEHAAEVANAALAMGDFARTRMALFIILALNMLRFSWQVTLYTAALVAAGIVYLRAVTSITGILNVTDGVIFGALVAILVYSTRRFRRAILQRSEELRAMQRQRLAALRGLVAGVTHEFNSPLGALKSSMSSAEIAVGRLRTKLAETDGTSAARTLDTLQSLAQDATMAVDRISETVETLQQFARLDQAEFKTTRLAEVLDVCKAVLRHRLTERIKITIECAPEISVVGHPADLNQLFVQLIDNALNALGEQGAIQISATASEGNVMVRVADDGPGMSDELVALATQPHFGAAGGRARLGLGLTTARAVAEDHGGSLAIETTLGKGTTVIVTLAQGRG